MKTVFKIGDKVFHYSYGWGEIIDLLSEDEWVKIRFKDNTYSFIGYNYISFTEYTLQGFSQERPIELPEVGDDVLVFDEVEHLWVLKQFKEYKKDSEYPFIVTDKLSFLVYKYAKMKRIKILD